MSAGTALAVTLLFAGCITSPVWEYGETKTAKVTNLPTCENGLLDDGEDGDTQIRKVDGRDGYWFAFVDQWGSKMEPKPFGMSKGGRNGDSGYAINIKGTLAATGDSIYAGVGFAFTNPKTPYDISRATGVRFWAKGPGRVRFKIPDRNTDPVGDRCTDCYNDFGVELVLEDRWQRYTVPFSMMTQKDGWGDRAPAVDEEGVFAVQWQVDTAGQPFDLWVDDIELVGCGVEDVP